MAEASGVKVTITYCAECGYEPQTLALAEALMKTFAHELTAIDLVLGNAALARGDASLALVVAMHTALLGRVRDAAVWPDSHFERVAREVVSARDGAGALINSLASEPEMGSPSRGGLPRTTAVRRENGWVLNGRKTFSS